MKRREDGFSAVELVVVSTMIGILASVAVPKFMMARDNASNSRVQNNTHVVQVALEQWAGDNNALYPADNAELVAKVVTDKTYLVSGAFPRTPWGTQQTAGIAWETASESLKAGDAMAIGAGEDPTRPAHFGAVSYAIHSGATANDLYSLVGTGKREDKAIVAIYSRN